MQSENLECQIAQAQMGRYLGGEGLSSEAISQLETHVRGCHGCKEAIQERRRSLESVLALPLTEDLPALKVSRSVNIKPASMKWVDAIRREPSEPATPAAQKTARWRTPAYAGGLVVVLISMSMLTKEPTKVFGDRAIDTVANRPAAKVASNNLPLVETSGESAIQIAEPKASYALQDFVPPFLMGAIKNFNPENTDKALSRQIMEVELAKMKTATVTKKSTTSRRRATNVIRIYPIATAKGAKK